jgi:GNAT superfamily N-acetyltransferase
MLATRNTQHFEDLVLPVINPWEIQSRRTGGPPAGASERDMPFTVRRAVIGDEAVLRALRLEALTDSPAAFGSTLERELARTTEDWRRWLAPGVTFLLEAGGKPCGLVAGSRDPQDSLVVHLMAMWVHPDQRGTGAADALLSSVKDWAAEVGATLVRLNVVESNGRARRCYERAGFCATDRQGAVEKTGDVEIEMTYDGSNFDN